MCVVARRIDAVTAFETLPVQRVIASPPPSELPSLYESQLDGILHTRFLTGAIDAKMERFHIGPLSVILLSASARESERRADRIARDQYDCIGVQYVVSGRARGEAAGRPVVSDPDSIMLLDYAQPFRIVDAEARVVLNVAVPRAMFPAGEGRVADQHGRIVSSGAGHLLIDFMCGLARDHRSYPRASSPALARVFLDLLAISLDSFPSGTTAAISGKRAQMIQRAEQLIDARIGSPAIGPEWLATKLSLSRSELYSGFQSFGGVARFILLRRLAAAHAALSDPRDTRRIGEIAYACGFASDAHFARSFRAHYGVTAGSIRRLETPGQHPEKL